MILQALTRYYEDLLSRGEIAAPGWAPAKISLALYINENGELTQIVPTMVEGTKGKKAVMQPQLMVLPAAVKRTVSIASNFLWDNSAYLLGIDQKGKPERSRECFAAAAKLHHAVLDGIDSPNARAILAFFDTWEPDRAAEHPALIRQLDDVTAGGNLVFRVDGRKVEEDAAIREAWQRYRDGGESGVKMQCLVTGKEDEIAAVHPSVKGVRDAHYERMEIAGAKYSILPLWALLNATVRDSKKQVPSPVVSGATVRAVFSGTPYPVSLMEAVLLRIRAERNVTWERAAILKAYLAKNYERGSDHSMFSEVTSVQLNEDCNYMPYLLGRLFRVMEEIQLASMGWSVNRSIRDSYFNSAASTPRSVFGKLFSLSNYHLKKLMRDKPGLGKKLGDLESDLAARLTTPPPARFTQEETICFYLGYYHQCNGKKEEKENV